jgi:hypothetical protein
VNRNFGPNVLLRYKRTGTREGPSKREEHSASHGSSAPKRLHSNPTENGSLQRHRWSRGPVLLSFGEGLPADRARFLASDPVFFSISLGGNLPVMLHKLLAATDFQISSEGFPAARNLPEP